MINKDNFKELVQDCIDTLGLQELSKIDNCEYIGINLHIFNAGAFVSIDTFAEYSPDDERDAAENGNLYIPIDDFRDLCNEFNVDLNP